MYTLPHAHLRIILAHSRARAVAAARPSAPARLHRTYSVASCFTATTTEEPRAAAAAGEARASAIGRAHSAPFPARTHHCGALSAKDAGSRVVLAGWLLPARKAGRAISFFPLRDAYGTLQLVASSELMGAEALAMMRDTPPESTVLVQGLVIERPPNQKRPQPGGDIEVSVSSFTLLNPALRDLPFMPSDPRNLPNEEHRLRYRYLDLRRPYLSGNLHKRSTVARIIRSTLNEHGFLEVETPILLKSTPEGAREFLVPTRLSSTASFASLASPSPSSTAANRSQPKPLFYALPQSPQQPKQLLIASGAVDRYYQIARCFRDEDGRKDRQPEFTQVDLEMAWVSWGSHQSHDLPTDNWRIGGSEVREIVQALVRNVWSRIEGFELPAAFNVVTYSDAMSRFGSDKPDTRFGLELRDVTQHLPLPLQATLSQRNEIVEALVAPSSEVTFQRAAAEIEPQESGIARIDVVENEFRVSGDNAVLSAGDVPGAFAHGLALRGGDTVWLAKRSRLPEGGSTKLGRLRLALASLAESLGDFVFAPEPHFLWVTEFPLFTHADADKEFLAHGRWSSSHHPFTAPMWEDIEKLYNGHIADVRGQHYDLVLNGTEIGGGSVRVHDPSMQDYIFTKILQLDDAEKASFNHLLHALRCGAPPHGGIALGFDRLMAILCKAESIRDVIAFPKTGAGTDLLFRSPAPSSDGTLEQYNIRTR